MAYLRLGTVVSVTLVLVVGWMLIPPVLMSRNACYKLKHGASLRIGILLLNLDIEFKLCIKFAK